MLHGSSSRVTLKKVPEPRKQKREKGRVRKHHQKARVAKKNQSRSLGTWRGRSRLENS